MSKRKSTNKTAASGKSVENLQDERNEQIAGTFFRQVLNDLGETGVKDSLIEILKTVRPWPTIIDKSGSKEFYPPFTATEISADETIQDDETITRVSFSYNGEKYHLLSILKNNSESDNEPGILTLHEGDELLIEMQIEHIQKLDHFIFQDLQFISFGPWIENIVQIETEIKQHQESTTPKSGV